MKIDEAIQRLKTTDACDSELCEALDMAIKALEQEPCGDCISRKSVSGYVSTMYYKGLGKQKSLEYILKYVERLPAVTPQPCEDCVSRHAALEAFGLSEKSRKYGGDHSGYETLMKYEIQDILEDLPSVTAQQKMGKWLYNKKEDSYKCSLCGFPCHKDNLGAIPTKYCAGCGAVMEVQNDKRTGN